MAYNVVPLQKLIEQFERLPGIGRKSAQRLAYYVLTTSDTATKFADAILDAKKKIRYCSVCQNLTDNDICTICSNDDRDKTVICVVENAQDVIAFERTREYKGMYHVLHGAISPLDSIGPDQLRIRELMCRLSSGIVEEIILATNPTVEGEATASYISRLVRPMKIRTTRLAYGIPVGGDLEYADEITLLRAMQGRNEI